MSKQNENNKDILTIVQNALKDGYRISRSDIAFKSNDMYVTIKLTKEGKK